MGLYVKSKVEGMRGILNKGPEDHKLPTWKRLFRVAIRLAYILSVLLICFLTFYGVARVLHWGTSYVYNFMQPFYEWARIREGAEGGLSFILVLLVFVPVLWAIIWEYKR